MQATQDPVHLPQAQTLRTIPRVATSDNALAWTVPKGRTECALSHPAAHSEAVAAMSSCGRDALSPALEPPPQSPRGRVVPQAAARG